MAGGGEGFCDVGMARVFLFCELGGEVMSTTQLYSCRHVLGLQAQSFVGQYQFSLKWMTNSEVAIDKTEQERYCNA